MTGVSACLGNIISLEDQRLVVEEGMKVELDRNNTSTRSDVLVSLS